MKNVHSSHPHHKQLHEKFKLVECVIENGKLTKTSKKSISDFLGTPNIHALSIGAFHVQKLPTGHEVIISIGHEQKKTKKHSYEVTLKNLGKFEGKDKLEKKLNALGAKTNNVICHEFFHVEDEIFAVLLSSN